MAEVGISFTATDQTGPTFDKVVSNYDRVKAAASSATDQIVSAVSYMSDKIGTAYDAAHEHFSALPEVILAGMVGAVGNIVVQMGLLEGTVGSFAAKIFSGGGAISTGMETASTSMITALGVQISSTVDKTVQTISAAAGGAVLSMMSAIGVIAIAALFASAVKDTLAWTESVAGLGKQLQMTSESASVYKVVTDEQKISTSDLASANTSLINTLSDNESAITDLGVATRNASGELKSSAELMPEVNTKLLGMTDSTEQNSKAVEIYGSKWNDLTGVMKINTATMSDATKQAQGLGLIVGKDNVDAAARYQTALATLDLTTKSLLISTGQNLLPIFANLYTVLADAAKYIVMFSNGFIEGITIAINIVGGAFGLLPITIDAAFRTINNTITGRLSEAKQNITDWWDAIKDYGEKVNSMSGGLIDATKPIPQASNQTSATDTAKSMQLELAALRQQNADKEALYKADSAIQLTIIKSTYDQGLSTTTEYYNAITDQSENSARSEVKSAQDYLAAVTAVVEKVKDLKGSASDEYKSALNSEAQAQQAVQMAELNLGKTMVENSIQTTAALKERQDAYSKIAIQILTDTGQYAAAEQKTQQMTAQSTDYLRLKKEAISGVANAAQALADTEQANSLATIAAMQKEAATRQQYADNYNAIQAKIETSDLKNANLIQAEVAVQDALNQKKEYENRLIVAKQSGVIADYNNAVKMVAAWDTHIGQLNRAVGIEQILAKQQDDSVLQQNATTYLNLLNQIDAANGKNQAVIQAESALQDGINTKKEYENKLEVAKQSGVLVDYNNTVKMVATWTTHIAQLTQAVDLVKRKADLESQNDAEQIIVNDMIAKGLDQQAFWLQKQIDLRKEQSKAAQDQLDYENKILQAQQNQNTELADTLQLDEKIVAENHQQAIDAINDRQMVANAAAQATTATSQTSTNSTVSSGIGYPGTATSGLTVTMPGTFLGNSTSSNVGSSLTNINAPFMGGLDGGTNYVPADGYAYIHKGEAVVPEPYNPAASGSSPSGDTTITITGGMNFTLPNVTNQSTAADLAREALPEIKRLLGRTLKAA